MLSVHVGESEDTLWREFKAPGKKPLTPTLASAGPAKARGEDLNYFYILRDNLRKEGFLPQGQEDNAAVALTTYFTREAELSALLTVLSLFESL